MFFKKLGVSLLFVCLGLTLSADRVTAESMAIGRSTQYSHSLQIMQETLAVQPVLRSGAERRLEAESLPSSTGAWLISIGLIGFIVSRQRFRKKDE